MKRLAASCMALVVLVVLVAAVHLVMRTTADGVPDDFTVLESAPTPLHPGSADGVEELEQQVRLQAERAGDDAPQAGVAGPDSARAKDDSRRFVFDCGDGVLFAVRTVPGEATLTSREALGAEVVTLPQVETASGARYAARGVSFWNKGGLATFELRDRTFADCSSNPGAAPTAEGARRATTFRAAGDVPPWVLEISQASLTMTTDNGAKRTEFPHREPTVAGSRTTYRSFAGTQELVVVIDRMPCNDASSGEAFDDTVAVTFDGTTLYGCGRIP